MHLVPTDCGQEETVLQLAHSLASFQRAADQTFGRAALRANKCRERMEMLGRRVEMLERKMDNLEQFPGVPVLHCAPKYPQVGVAGLADPVFPRQAFYLGADHQVEDESISHPTSSSTRGGGLAHSQQCVKDGFIRKQNLPVIFRKNRWAESALFNEDKLAKLIRKSQTDEPKLELADLGKAIIGHEESSSSSPEASNQIDFSESLLDLCPARRRGIGGGGEAEDEDEMAGRDPFAYEPVGAMSEMAEFDLPEDLPGMDVKSISLPPPPQTWESQSAKVGSGNSAGGQQSKSEKKVPEDQKLGTSRASTSADWEEKQGMDESKAEVATKNPMIPVPAPPPPPPPPPPPLVQSDHPSTSQSEEPGQSAAGGGAERSDLMAAIRAAGGMKGANLRRVEEVKEKEEGGMKSSKRGEEPEDLMSSLAKALEKRRRGISGKNTGGGPSSAGAEKSKKSGGGRGGAPFSELRERIPRIRAGSGDGPEEDEEGADEGPEWK